MKNSLRAPCLTVGALLLVWLAGCASDSGSSALPTANETGTTVPVNTPSGSTGTPSNSGTSGSGTTTGSGGSTGSGSGGSTGSGGSSSGGSGPGGSGGGTQSSSGSLPVAPKVTSVYAQTEGATLFFTNQMPANGNYVQYYTATSNPGGITARSNGASNRIDISGLTGGVNYTFTVTATNAAGTGPASAPSASVTAGNYADYWVANGFAGGLNSEWSFYPGSAGNGVTWNAQVSGVTVPSGTTVVKFQLSGSNLFTLPFVEHSLIDSNGNPAGVDLGGGKFLLGAFKYLAISIWPTQAGQKVGFQLYQTNSINGMLTQGNGPSETLFTDATQNWTPNYLSSKGFTFINLTHMGGNPITSNTADSVTTNSVGQNAVTGDFYEISEPDIDVGNYVTVGDGKNPSWGPTTMTAGQWNTYRIPLSAFGNDQFPYGNQILKFAIQDQLGTSSNTFYATAIGFTNH